MSYVDLVEERTDFISCACLFLLNAVEEDVNGKWKAAGKTLDENGLNIDQSKMRREVTGWKRGTLAFEQKNGPRWRGRLHALWLADHVEADMRRHVDAMTSEALWQFAPKTIVRAQCVLHYSSCLSADDGATHDGTRDSDQRDLREGA